VPLSRNADKVVFVVRIPQGSTAYQAKNGRYYGRSEFEVKFLPDHEVRMRMSRGKVARAGISAHVVRAELGAVRERQIFAKNAKTIEAFSNKTPAEALTANPDLASEYLELLSAHTYRDKVTFDFVFRNDGELTIREPVVELGETRAHHLFDGEQMHAQILARRLKMDQETFYPGDERTISGSERWIECKRGASFAHGDYVVH
jgi:hypothetical protein